MKKLFFVILQVAFLTGSLISSQPIFAQKKEYRVPDENGSFHFSLVNGVGSLQKEAIGFSGGIAMAFQQKNHFIQARVFGIYEFIILVPEYHTGIEVSVLYGYTQRIKKWKYNVAAGAGYYRFSTLRDKRAFFGSLDPLSIEKINHKNSLGLPLSAEILYKPKKTGIGVNAHANINAANSYFGAGLAACFTL